MESIKSKIFAKAYRPMILVLLSGIVLLMSYLVSAWSQGNWVFLLGSSITIALLFYSIIVMSDGWNRNVTVFFFLFSISNVIDHLLFDPSAYQLNDYILWMMIAIIYVFYLRKQNNTGEDEGTGNHNRNN